MVLIILNSVSFSCISRIKLIQTANSYTEDNVTRLFRLSIYTVSHFCVDFCCFYVLYSWYSGGTHSVQTVSAGFLAYNITAFGLQPLIGYLSDTYRKIPTEVIGCPLLAAGLLFTSVPAVSIILIGLGNACFHIAGGADSLRQSGGKMAKSGIFVSSGALGVVSGIIAGKSGRLSAYVPMGILLVCFILLCILYKKRMSSEDEETAFSVTKPNLKFGIIILFAAVSIAVRSYVGSVLPVEWNTTPVLFLFPAAGAFLGKACGGFIADRIGAGRTAVLSLLPAAVLLAFGYMNPYVCITGIILFNMSMSVTLCAAASVLPLNPGLAFGITTIALLCGNVPTFFIAAAPAPLTIAVLTAVSAACLYYILEGKVKSNQICTVNKQPDV